MRIASCALNSAHAVFASSRKLQWTAER